MLFKYLATGTDCEAISTGAPAVLIPVAWGMGPLDCNTVSCSARS